MVVGTALGWSDTATVALAVALAFFFGYSLTIAPVKNVLIRQRWQTRAELRLAIVVWIEKTYHRRRRQDAVGRMTPIEFEILTQAANAA